MEGLARYISRQHLCEEGYERAKGRRRWFGSRNLVRPQPKETTGAISGKKVKELCTVEVESREPFERMYQGWFLSRVEAQQNEVNGGYYLHVRMYRVGSEFGAKKRRKDPAKDRKPTGAERRRV